MKNSAGKGTANPAVLSLAQLLAGQPAVPPPGWIEPGLLPPEGILFVGGEPKVGKSLLVANLALAWRPDKTAWASLCPPRVGCSSASLNFQYRSLFPALRSCARR